jgi:DNA-binding CsgD family transcriptional regulator
VRREGLALLSRRELEVLAHILHGKTTQEIGPLLCISPKTAETHRTHMNKKLQVGSFVELLLLAVAQGWIVGRDGRAVITFSYERHVHNVGYQMVEPERAA